MSCLVFSVLLQLQEVGECVPCSFRSLDARPGSYDLVAGTSRCEIWEITREVRLTRQEEHTQERRPHHHGINLSNILKLVFICVNKRSELRPPPCNSLFIVDYFLKLFVGLLPFRSLRCLYRATLTQLLALRSIPRDHTNLLLCVTARMSICGMQIGGS